MTKKVIIMASLAAMTLTFANAQTVMGVGPNPGWYHIPSEFTADGHSKIATLYNETVSIYNHNLQVEHSFPLSQIRLHEVELSSIDHFTNGGDYGRVYLTQTLFNTDENYEYFVINGYENEMWRGGSILSENGTVIWSWTPSGNHWGAIYLVEWDEYYYIVTDEETSYNEETDESTYVTTWYSIDRQTQSISQVDVSLSISVHPTVADRSQTITVELGEGNNATEVQVVNAVGQVVKTIAVQPDQREVMFSASDLGSGVHIVGAHSHRQQGTCKIIIK